MNCNYSQYSTGHTDRYSNVCACGSWHLREEIGTFYFSGGLRCRTSAEPASGHPSKPKEKQHWHNDEYTQKNCERFRVIHDVRVRTFTAKRSGDSKSITSIIGRWRISTRSRHRRMFGIGNAEQRTTELSSSEQTSYLSCQRQMKSSVGSAHRFSGAGYHFIDKSRTVTVPLFR
jgi:hypothetical protein